MGLRCGRPLLDSESKGQEPRTCGEGVRREWEARKQRQCVQTSVLECVGLREGLEMVIKARAGGNHWRKFVGS